MNRDKGKKVLLIEDNPDDELLTLKAFQKNNILNEITVVRDGQEALDWLSHLGNPDHPDSSALPAVVLLDLKLPRVDGTEVLRQIRLNPRTRMLPVVILTSSREERDIIESYKLGANSYVSKPIDFTEFSEAINRLGVYWLLVNEIPPRKKQKEPEKAA